MAKKKKHSIQGATTPAPGSSSKDTLNPFAQEEPSSSGPQVGTGLYDLDYFSGSQAALYIGDVWVDEVVNFQYSVQQSKQPIYGYASQLFDDVSAGTVLVQGSFSINFKESGYLWLVLQRYKRFDDATKQIISKYGNTTNILTGAFPVLGAGTKDFNKATNTLPLGDPAAASIGSNNPFARIQFGNKHIDAISRANIERLISGEATKSERFQFYNDLSGYATSNNPHARDTVFENVVEVFEDRVWEDNTTDLEDEPRRIDSNFYDNFDMFVTYGDYTKPGANHTVRKITGVRLLGMAQSIEISGEPVLEQYSFIARNIL
jgi:hypothetical protein